MGVSALGERHLLERREHRCDEEVVVVAELEFEQDVHVPHVALFRDEEGVHRTAAQQSLVRSVQVVLLGQESVQ